MLYPNNSNQQDTPFANTDMFGVPVNEQDQQDSWRDENSAPNQGQPEQPANTPQDNEERRYQYWQSQHDILKNQYAQLEKQNQELQSRLAPIEQQMQKQPEPEEERFPDPPAPPQKPYSFSQTDAMSDPSSDSARYLVQLAEYNSVMGEYNNLKANWIEEKHRERFSQLAVKDQQRVTEEQRRAEIATQVNQVIASVQQKYGADYETALDFVNTMSDNSSITIDNLFELYKMKKGITQGGAAPVRYTPQQNPNQQFNPWGVQVSQPSPEFQQRQRAQSIPPAMGVHNAQGVTTEDPMMAAFRQTIKNSNNQNIY